MESLAESSLSIQKIDSTALKEQRGIERKWKEEC